jgi:hypothetical protein
MNPGTSVRFDFTQDDFIAFNLYHHAHSPATRSIKARMIFFILAIGAVSLAIKLLRPQSHDVLWGFALGSVIGALIFPWSFRRSLRRNVGKMLSEGKNKNLLGPREIVLSPAELRSTGSMGAATTAWPAVERIVKGDDVLYLYTTSMSAVVVPRRAFASDAEFALFEETARKYLAEAAGRAK